VAHEGIDTENLGPDPDAVFKTPSGEILRANDPDRPVITYVARNLEPYRGFHTFMRALPAVQKAHKNAHVLIVGGDAVSYGSRPKEAKNWREKMLGEVCGQLDPARTHFLGKLPYQDYKRVLQVSSAHVYLTYPFVLSWSCLEAMATGCLMVASDTAPVREALQSTRNTSLPTLFDQYALKASLSAAIQLQKDQVMDRAFPASLKHQGMGIAAGRKAYESIVKRLPKY
jgi:glycosyltransferase involved in cell wall biosynthesis